MQLPAVILLLTSALWAATGDWVIEPGARVGRIRADSSEQALVKIYGPQQVKEADIDVGEGMSEPGTILFPDDPSRTLSILWKDAATRLAPKSIRINSKKSAWRTKNGITIGTSLKRIERLNRKPFRMAGFGFDYSGTILDCDGGRLRELGTRSSNKVIRGRTLLLRLDPDPETMDSKGYSAVTGDRDFSSGHPAMQKLDPKVYDIVVLFE